MRDDVALAPHLCRGPATAYDLPRILEDVLGGFALRHDRNHGVGHWARVMANGHALARQVGANLDVVELFALLHDAKRQVEGVDPEHGARAADYVYDLSARGLVRLSSQDLDTLAFACRHHSSGRRDGPLLAQICWDADHLDLGRVGISPSPERLCTPAAQAPAFFAAAVEAGRSRGLPDFVAAAWNLAWDGARAHVRTTYSPHPPLVFHGALIEPGTTRDVFRFRRHEPTLTYDLATACLIYATPAHNPNRHRYTSAVGGLCLALRPTDWRPEPPPTARLWADHQTRAIKGGVTKWVGGYLSPYRAADRHDREAYAAKFRRDTLRSDPHWKAERGEFLRLDAADIVHTGQITAQLRTWLASLDVELKGGPAAPRITSGWEALTGKDGVAVAAACWEARACRWVRRLFLSLLSAKGVPVISVDVIPHAQVTPPVLWSASDLATRLDGLSTALARRPATDRLRQALDCCLSLSRLDEASIQHADQALAVIDPLTAPSPTC